MLDYECNKIEFANLEQVCSQVLLPPVCDNVAMNNRFAHAYHLKKYAGIDEESFLNCPIEHGLNIVHDAVCAYEVSQNCHTVITFSEYRKNIIEKYTEAKGLPIGPYIAYSNGFYDKESLQRLKKKYGRTLLVFPSHGAESAEASYNVEKFLDKISELSNSFDSVLVCLFFLDISQKNIEMYYKRGFEVVTSGNNYDINFLPRQRSLLELSDAVMGNDFTTGFAYALYLDKPIYLFKQSISLDGKNVLNEGLISRNEQYMKELYELSADPAFGNLEKQKEWANYMFGMNCVKSKEEMRNILKTLLRNK